MGRVLLATLATLAALAISLLVPPGMLRAASAPSGPPLRDTPPPEPMVRQCAEWEPVTGVLVQYPFGLTYGVLREMAEDIELWVIVANASQQAQCTAALQTNGVNMAHVRFAILVGDSFYTRDYGPQFVFSAHPSRDRSGPPNDAGIVDFHYWRQYDDQINYGLGSAWTVPVFGAPLSMEGGNLMCDGHGNAVSTDFVYTENPGTPPEEIAAGMYGYLGTTNYHVIQDVNPAPTGVHHVDCWTKLLDEETLLVAQFNPASPWYARAEENAAEMGTWTNAFGRHYRIVRVYCGGGTEGTSIGYTNSIILNRKVLVPTQVSAPPGMNGAALQVYRNAMPGYEVIGCDANWSNVDAIHCRSMGIHDKYMLRVDLAPLPDTIQTSDDVRVDVNIDDRSEAGLKADSLLVYWRTAGQAEFQPLHLAAGTGVDSFFVDIPGKLVGTRVEYWVFAADESGRRERRPYVAPAGYYAYYVAPGPAAVPSRADPSSLDLAANGPNPFSGETTIRFHLPFAAPASLKVIDIRGRELTTLIQGALPAGGHSVRWNGRDASGTEMPSGIYFFRLDAGERTAARRGLLLRR